MLSGDLWSRLRINVSSRRTGDVLRGAFAAVEVPQGRGKDSATEPVDYVLAQVNVGRLVASLDSPELAAFIAALDPVNSAADAAPGFIWRLQTENGNATSVVAFSWDAGDSAGIIVNMSVWESAEALEAFIYSESHRPILRRRREFFHQMPEAYAALWWIPGGTVPTTDDAEERVRHLRAHGPGPFAFTLRQCFPAPSAAEVS